MRIVATISFELLALKRLLASARANIQDQSAGRVPSGRIAAGHVPRAGHPLAPSRASDRADGGRFRPCCPWAVFEGQVNLSLIHISEPTRRTPISYAVFCLKKKKKTIL